MKRPIRKPPEQTAFVIILAGQGHRYRNVILAHDEDEAREKAIRMAATLTGNFEVQAVRRAEAMAPTGNALAGQVAMALGAARGSDPARSR